MIMSMKKILMCLFLLLTTFIGLNKSKNNNLKQAIRTIEYNKFEFDDTIFDNFDSHEIIQNNEDITINAKKAFDSALLNEFDLVSLDDNQDKFMVTYELNYIENEDTVFLSATILGVENIPIIDTIPGLVSINSKGESDILFSNDDELFWLSELNDSSSIDNCGWFTNLVKKLTNKVVQVASNIVRMLEPIIRPAVNIATYFAIKLIGDSKAAYLGATILNMKADTEGIYHANFNCRQQYFGYTDLYDAVFDSSTSMRYGKFEFDINHDGYTDYVLWAWKGNYLNLGAGAELGIYKRWEYSDEIWKVDKSNAMTMTLKLEHKTKGTLFDWCPKEKQWWITGFDPKVQNVNRDELKDTYSVEFANTQWYECFKNEWQSKDKRWNFSNYKPPILVL